MRYPIWNPYFATIILSLLFSVNCDRNALFTGLEEKPVSSPGLITTIDRNTTSEKGDAATISVRLATEPSSDVTVIPTSNNSAEGRVSISMLTFTSSNWDTDQTIVVTGQNDSVYDGDVSYTVVINTNSGDTNYNGLNKTFDFTNTTNDRYMFLTSAGYNGNFDQPSVGGNGNSNGVEEADDKCNTDANRPDPALKYSAVIVDNVYRRASAAASAGDSQIDWVLLGNTDYYLSDGSTVVGTTAANGLFVFPLTSAPSASGFFWTGLNADWTSSTENCGAWGSSALNGIRGSASSKTDTLIYFSPPTSCTSASYLLCVQEP